jgi:hypothetical protein
VRQVDRPDSDRDIGRRTGARNRLTLTDITGKPRKLADLRGKYVVLGGSTSECPFVQKLRERQHARSA